jgi:predicted RNA-binding Zn-ribbon protein involved in translation (DUF1610 family)
MTEPSEIQKIISVPCEACGAQMHYSATHGKMYCKHCGHTQAVPVSKDQIIERSFSEALDKTKLQKGLGVTVKTFACKNCGAITQVDAKTVAFSCDFCGSNNVNEEAHDDEVIRPQGLIPFIIDRKQAVQTFKDWITVGWFTPNNLKKVRDLAKIEGVYVPFWTYDAKTESSWAAEAGYHYYVEVETTDANGNKVYTKQQRTRWEPVSGYDKHNFDDVLVIASKGVSQNRAQQVYPYRLNDTVNYEPKFMLGWKAEVAAIPVEQGFKVADKIMDNFIEQDIIRTIPGDTYRNLEIRTRKHHITFKHILLPIWIAAYTFDNRLYQVIVNGQTGQISGEKPVSWAKIMLAVLVGILVLTILYFVFRK